MTALYAVTENLQDMLDCVSREIRLRERVYPAWVAKGRMTRQKANHEIRTMKAVHNVLMRASEKDRLL